MGPKKKGKKEETEVKKKEEDNEQEKTDNAEVALREVVRSFFRDWGFL